MSYKKVGGLHFVRIGRFGFSFFVSKKVNAKPARVPKITSEAEYERACKRSHNLALLRGDIPSHYEYEAASARRARRAEISMMGYSAVARALSR